MLRCIAAVIVPVVLMVGCQPSNTETVGTYRTVPIDPRRDTQAAQRYNAEGIKLLQMQKLGEAERVFKAACNADVFFGPAHNNLGTVYFHLKKYYLAAWEFQYAAKLMPKHSEPRNNLGMVFEAVGKLDEAAEWYDKAIALSGDDVEALGNLARVYVRQGRKDQRTRQLLEELVLKDTRPQWRAWARQTLVMMRQDSSSSPPSPAAGNPTPTEEHTGHAEPPYDSE